MEFSMDLDNIIGFKKKNFEKKNFDKYWDNLTR